MNEAVIAIFYCVASREIADSYRAAFKEKS